MNDLQSKLKKNQVEQNLHLVSKPLPFCLPSMEKANYVKKKFPKIFAFCKVKIKKRYDYLFEKNKKALKNHFET